MLANFSLSYEIPCVDLRKFFSVESHSNLDLFLIANSPLKFFLVNRLLERSFCEILHFFQRNLVSFHSQCRETREKVP